MTDIPTLVSRGALFVANHSGGKDSQLMLIRMLEQVPASQILVVHATLGEFEWPGALEHAQQQAEAAGLPFLVAKAVNGEGADKSFFDMVRKRHADRPESPCWPGGKGGRQCTSDLKRGPIEREVRRYMEARGLKLVVNCMGIRAAEGTERAKKSPFHQRTGSGDGLARAGREAWNWMPIFDVPTAAVIPAIRAAGQQPHWAYAAGNERLSCMFCIYASKNDLRNGAKHNPELFARYVAMEAETGYSMHVSRKPLAQLVAEATL